MLVNNYLNVNKNIKDDWDFIPNKDSWGSDIVYYPNKTIDQLFDIVMLYPECVGFNTYGYFKSKINLENKFINLDNKYNSTDGIYIKKSNIDKKKYDMYNKILIDKITEKVKNHNKKKQITFSITTCKRIDLFEKTMNSFLYCCNDILLIDEYICVDDNSTEEDRDKMKNLYPFFNFIMKTPEQKGHINSMNIIKNSVKTPYLIHMEDDWLFYVKGYHILDALNIMNQTEINPIDDIPSDQDIHNKKIGQVLFNKNYIEIEDRNILGGYLCKTDNFTNYLVHEHYDESKNYVKFLQLYEKYGKSCVYWPHYSLRPSLLKTEIFKNVGNYTNINGFFELDYAKRYYQQNYISCFLNKVICRHIGKLTFETSIKNAYKLNNISQFEVNIKYKVICVNLERRQDRRNDIVQLFSSSNIDNYEFYNAIDGYKLEPTDELANLFYGNDFQNKKGVIGCALSHYNLWKELSESSYDYFVIFEDDIMLTNNFKNKFDNILTKLNSNINEYECLFLGYSMYNEERKVNSHIYDDKCTPDILIEKLNKNLYIGGTFSYIITKQGANKLLKYIKNNGIKHGIDYLMVHCTDLNYYETQPSLVFSECCEFISSDVDSDIQKNNEKIDFTIFYEKNNQKLVDCWDFYNYVDFPNNDIKYIGDKTPYELSKIALTIPNCSAFNTLGFLKYDVDSTKLKETPWININIGGGIYIKKSEIK